MARPANRRDRTSRSTGDRKASPSPGSPRTPASRARRGRDSDRTVTEVAAPLLRRLPFPPRERSTCPRHRTRRPHSRRLPTPGERCRQRCRPNDPPPPRPAPPPAPPKTSDPFAARGRVGGSEGAAPAPAHSENTEPVRFRRDALATRAAAQGKERHLVPYGRFRWWLLTVLPSGKGQEAAGRSSSGGGRSEGSGGGRSSGRRTAFAGGARAGVRERPGCRAVAGSGWGGRVRGWRIREACGPDSALAGSRFPGGTGFRRGLREPRRRRGRDFGRDSGRGRAAVCPARGRGVPAGFRTSLAGDRLLQKSRLRVKEDAETKKRAPGREAPGLGREGQRSDRREALQSGRSLLSWTGR